MKEAVCSNVPFGHPCFNEDVRHKYGRVHLPVAPGCNIKCKYCVRRFNCVNESRPGVTAKLISPKEAISVVREALKMHPEIVVVGVAGPGEPLANENTFETFSLIHQEFPWLQKCLSTNGLVLVDKLDILEQLEIRAVTITINAVDPRIGKQIYSWVKIGGVVLSGEAGVAILIERQLQGLRLAVQRGIKVKVNSVLIPTINENHLLQVAREIACLGAFIHNIVPLIPQGEFAHLYRPTGFQLERIRAVCESAIKQKRHCIQCRADAIGLCTRG